MTVADEIERLAWQVLRTVNRMQAKDSSVRLVVPRAPEVADELESPPNDAELLTVEEYLSDGWFAFWPPWQRGCSSRWIRASQRSCTSR
jgi:hypothetical protein